MANFKNYDELIKMVAGIESRVVVPGANNEEALSAVKGALENDLISAGILLGDTDAVKKTASEVGLSLDKFEIMHVPDQIEMCKTAVDLIAQKKGDFLIKGLVNTSDFVRAILNKEKGLVPEGALLTHLALMETANYHKLFAISDSAILISPDLAQKVKIIRNAVDVLRAIGIEEPKVSVVCPVEKVNPKITSTLHAQGLVDMYKNGDIKNCVVEGPYDVYITLSKKLAEEKGIVNSRVAGEADLLLMPDLNAANITYKSISFFGEGYKGATILVGANVPVVLPSRADSSATKLHSIALATYLKGKVIHK